MDTQLYSDFLKKLKQSATQFLGSGSSSGDLMDEIEEDLSEIINVINISEWECNIGGTMIGVPQLLIELENANHNNDRQKCIESIAMLRVAISDIETAFSNTVDSMENLIISIRDDK